MQVPGEYIRLVLIGGKQVEHVILHGLVALAHEAGIKTLDTEIVANPGAGLQYCITRTTITMRGGKRFSALGDADPISIKNDWQERSRLVKWASFRSQGEALKLALGVDLPLYEGTSTQEQPTQSAKQPLDIQLASPCQIRLLRVLASKLGIDNQTMETFVGIGRQECSDLIKEWKNKLEAAG